MKTARRAAQERTSGILLHPSCLPSPYGIGDLGPGATAWLEWLKHAGCTLWQVLPLGPTGYGDSPYQGLSSAAGNPLLISPQGLLDDGLLTPDDLDRGPRFSQSSVDYSAVIAFKERLLGRAMERLEAGEAPHLQPAYEAFLAAQHEWLRDHGLFMALKDAQGGAPWTDWPPDLAPKGRMALQSIDSDLRRRSEEHGFRQFLFFLQWDRLRQRASELGIRILGDVPLFVAHDSVDVWSRPDLYRLDERGRPNVLSGVPPDHFSKTGQLWGNPLYRWEAHAAEGYRWWLQRLRHALSMADFLRLDHFRGLHAHWEIPAGADTAMSGRWVKGPGASFLEAVRREWGELPLVAEDLGLITPDVRRLRDQFNLPGMRVLQFAFTGGPENEHLPENYPARTVAYTGTHDNDTAVGWHDSAAEEERMRLRTRLGRRSAEVAWDLLRLVWESGANWAIAPMQDFLSLGSEARMNHPGRPEGNWRWRVREAQLDPGLAERIRTLNQAHGRLGPVKP